MADKRFSIVFDAKMEIGSIKAALDEINKITNNTALNLPKGISGSLTKTIQSIRTELNKLEGMQGLEPNAKNANAITKSYENIFTKFQSLQALMGDLGKDIKIDPKKFFPPEIVNSIKQATAALDEYHKKIKEGPQSEDYKQKNTKLKAARQQESAATKRHADEIVKYNEAVALRKSYKDLTVMKKTSDDASADSKKANAEVERLIKNEKLLLSLAEKRRALETQKSKLNSANEGSRSWTNANNNISTITKEIEELEKQADAAQIAGESLENLQTKLKNAQDALTDAKTKAKEAESAYQNELKKQNTNEANIEKHKIAYEAAAQSASEAAKEVQKLNKEIEAAEQTHANESFEKLVKVLEKIQGFDASKIKSIEDINTALSSLNVEALNKIEQAFAAAGVNAKDLGIDLEKLKGNVQGFEGISASAQRAADDMSMLQSRINYFFSSLNMINLFKRTVKEAINTVKELDAVMTETAVVTDFTVGDMWDKLPQYAAQANSLGASIKDMYAATTLYYQQGLQTDAAMSVGVETMKMARIAGMEAADATTAMTAALRGFNMEVNEMNAQRVNDVYSELAAITAADTSQIATAMSKTASIAESANMEFETTAALLAQIIETTQEAPETAGTAMKTIIARFTEVKKLFSQGMLTGEDEEGEAISINKIDDALKTVGISLKDFLNGSKGIDDIFLELASKWDTLDLATQRYIATAAAGSRQQSRFIAMMSNYDRTMELVTAANNSAGASQEQFDKTLESMEAKLQRLKNAWDQFVMGLANNDLLKAGVDALTGLLNAINNLTSGLSGNGGVAKSLLSLLTIVGALKGGKGLLTGMGLLGEGKGGFSLSAGYGKGFQMSLGKKSAVDQVVGANSQQRAQALGRRDGQSYFAGFQRAAQARSAGGSGFGAFFGTWKGPGIVKRKELQKQNANILSTATLSNSQKKELIGENIKKFDARTFTPDFSAISMGAAAAGVAITGLGKCFEKAGPQGQAFGRALEKVGSTLTSIGSIGMMLGPTLNNLGLSFSKAGIHIAKAADGAADAAKGVGDVAKGLDKAGDVVDDVAEGTVAVGTSSIVAGSQGAGAATSLAASWSSVLPVLGWVALAIAAIAAVSFAAYKMHPETQLKEAKQAAENAENGASNAKTAYEELNSSIAALDDKRAKIDDMTRGTSEWKSEVQSLNDEILKLVEQNPELAAFVKNKNGVLELDKSGATKDAEGRTYEEVMEKEAQEVAAAQVAKYDAQRKVLEKQQRVDYLDYVRKDMGNGINAGRMEQMGINGDFAEITNSVAKAMSSGDIQIDLSSGADKASNTQIISDYIRQNFGYGDHEADALAEELASQVTSLQQFGNALMVSEAQIKLYNDQLANQVIEAADIQDPEKVELLQSLDSSIVQGMYDDAYRVAASNVASKTRKEKRKEYAEMMGYEWRGGNTYYDGEKEFTVKAKDMRASLAAKGATEIAGEKADDLATFLSGKNDAQKGLFQAVFGQEGMAMTKEVLNEWGHFNEESGRFEMDLKRSGLDTIEKIEDFQYGKTWAEDYYGILNNSSLTSDEIIEKMQKADVANQMVQAMDFEDLGDYMERTGKTIEEAISSISDSFEMGGDALLDTRKNLVKKMTKYTTSNKENEIQAQNLALLEKTYGEEIIGTISNVFSSLELSGNRQLISAASGTFLNLLGGVGEDGKTLLSNQSIEQISDFIGNVNWGSAIDSAAALREEIEQGSGAAKAYAQILMDSNLDFLSIGNQTQELLKSEGFVEIQGELDEILKTNDEIKASDVKDLAKSYKTLDKYLDNTNITASGLAKALTEVSKHNLGIDDLTSSVMAAISSFNSLDDTIANVLDELENFDLGQDENKIGETMSSWADIVKKNIDKHAYGNSQTDTIFDYLFGSNWDKQLQADGTYAQITGQNMIDTQKKYLKFMQQNKDNFGNAWSQFASGKDMEGNEIADRQEEIATNLESKDISLKNGGPQVGYGKNGGIELTDIGDMTTEQLTAWVAETYGVTENLAEMMIADLSNFSTDIAPVLAKNDYSAGIQAAIDNAEKATIDGKEKTTFDQKEIDTIAKMAGKTPGQVVEDIRTKLGEEPLITNFFDEKGVLKEGEDLLNELGKAAGKGDKSGKKFINDFIKYDGERYDPTSGYFSKTFKLKEFQEQAISFGLNQQQADQAANEALAQITKNQKVEVEIETDTGEFVTVMAEAGDTIEELKKRANMTEEANQIAEALGAAIVSAYEQLGEFKFTVSDETTEDVEQITAPKTIDVSANTSNAKTAVDNWWAKNSKKTITVGAELDVNKDEVTAEGPSGTLSFKLFTHAKGIKNAPYGHLALTGEEGPELVQTKNGAYLVGQNGPEMAYIGKGDTVYTAEETKQIFSGSNPQMMPRFNDGNKGENTITGYLGIINGPSGKGKVGDDKKDIDIDKLYNILEDIEEALRTREKLEREYNRILEHVVTSAKDLIAASEQQLAHLQDEKARQEIRKEARINQSNQYMEENKDYQKYVWVETREDGERVTQIDWEAINNISDDKEKEKVQEYLSTIEEFEDDINEAEDAIFEIEESVKEIKNRGKDEMLDFESQVKDAIINERQEQIDKLSDINDSINDTNSRLLEAMQQSIEESRQARENQKTEEELSDKQRRLAYLQQDTSGANALEILALQKEIEEQQEDYTDTLIDQKISDLQKQNDEAAFQRQQQIDIAQAQLDNYIETGKIWDEVYRLMGEGIGENGMIIEGSELMNTLKNDADYASMSHLEQLEWAEELTNTVAQGLTWLQIGRQTEDIDGLNGKEISFTTKDGKVVTGTVGEDGKVTTGDGTVYDKVYQNYDGSYKTEEQWIDPASVQQQPEPAPEPEAVDTEIKVGSQIYAKGAKIYSWPGSKGDHQYFDNEPTFSPIYDVLEEQDGWIKVGWYNRTNKEEATGWFKKEDVSLWDGQNQNIETGSGYIAPELPLSKKSQKISSPGDYLPAGVEGTYKDEDGVIRGTYQRYDPTTKTFDNREAYFDETEKQWYFYKTGGLADFTGPAWLDGTKTRPEYVLNASQTSAFFNLVDVLESFRNGSATKASTENNGDTKYDIDINVESIGSDYDVEQVAATVKRLITENARYRNNNTINLKR